MHRTEVNKLIGEGTPISRHDRSSYFQRSYGADSSRNNSGFMTPSGIANMSSINTSFASPNLRNDFGSVLSNANLTSTSQKSIFEPPLFMDITEDTTSVALQMSNADPASYASNLFQEFLDFYQSYSGEHEIFDLLLQYEEVCGSSAKQLLKLINKVAPTQRNYKSSEEVLKYLQLERNTWRLVRTLFQDRLLTENINEERMHWDNMGEKLSDKQIIQNLFSQCSAVRQGQLVVDWLEKNAAEDFPDVYLDKLEYFADQTTSWEHTLHELKNTSMFIERPTRDSLITELDPDAPIRQKNNVLHAADKEDETRLLKCMFVSIRAGNLDEAQRLAENFGQPWLAASLEGWRLYHDPNYENESLIEGNTLLPIEGNKYRDIWKTACWRMACESRIPLYQQAIFGSLCGNLKSMLRACSNWDDYLWSYMRAFVDKQTEQELRSYTQCERPLEELPAEYWDKVLDFEQIFQELNACISEDVRKQGQGHHQLIQKYIVLDDIDGLIEVMHSWVSNSPGPSSHLLRIMAHLVLFLRVIGRSTKEEFCVAILEAYVKDLIEQQKISLVAYYAATLPPAHQVIWYAKFLEGITDSAERQLCLKYAEEAGLNLPLITKTVVENVRNKVSTEPESSEIVNAVMSEEDEEKIHALDWLIFSQLQRAEAMKQANALMRIFVVCQKLTAARLTFAKIPVDSISLIMKQNAQTGRLELKAEDDNAIREYLCFKAYLEAFDAFNDWFQHFQHAKPKCPEPPAGGNMKFKEKVAFEHEMRQYELELDRWGNALMAQTKTTTDRLYNVLLFVSGGWMVDQRKEDFIDEGRIMQMAALRKMCIPQIAKLLHNVLFSTQLYKESVQLADIIASERNKLYKEFSVQELRQFLSSLSESSLALLNQNVDPLGYSFELSDEHVS